MANLHPGRRKKSLWPYILTIMQREGEHSSSFYRKQGIISYILLFLLITTGPKSTLLPIYSPATRRVTI